MLKESTILPDEFVFTENDIPDKPKHLYFISEGEINILMQKNK